MSSFYSLCCIFLSFLKNAKYIKNEIIEFEMIEGPPMERVQGSWKVSLSEDGYTDVTFKVYVKAGKAGIWLLRTASRYLEHKAAGLINIFQQQVFKEFTESKEH